MKLALVLIGLLTANLSFAGESGVIVNGKKHVLFKDGNKVGEMPALGREVASTRSKNVKKVDDGINLVFVRYVEDSDNGVICYFSAQQDPSARDLSCVKM